MAKVVCPYHEDKNPSVEVYEDGGFCFPCNRQIPLRELGQLDFVPEVKPVEDLQRSLGYIRELPFSTFRGFSFPFDSSGFYIVWPNAVYYKQRMFDPKAKAKYRGPSGHKPPLFWAQDSGSPELAVVEGELEALSLSTALGANWDIVSPGAAGQFKSKELVSHCLRRETVLVFVDNDAPGIKAAKELASELVGKIPKLIVAYKDKERDFNKVLCENGVEELRQEVSRRLSGGVCWENNG